MLCVRSFCIAQLEQKGPVFFHVHMASYVVCEFQVLIRVQSADFWLLKLGIRLGGALNFHV